MEHISVSESTLPGLCLNLEPLSAVITYFNKAKPD